LGGGPLAAAESAPSPSQERPGALLVVRTPRPGVGAAGSRTERVGKLRRSSKIAVFDKPPVGGGSAPDRLPRRARRAAVGKPSPSAAEIWKPIAGFKGLYEISDRGRVRSLGRECRNGTCTYWRKGRVLRNTPNNNGYPSVRLADADSRYAGLLVHRLVALHFVLNPDPDRLSLVTHRDGCLTNAAAENLVWTSHLDICLRTIDAGRFERVKLSIGFVEKLRAAFAARPLTRREARVIAGAMGVSMGTVYRARSGNRWSRVSCPAF
jgi:hypothetical protein